MKQLIRLLFLMLFFLAGTHPEVQAHAMREKVSDVSRTDLIQWSRQALKEVKSSGVSAEQPFHDLRKRPFRKFCLPDNEDSEEDPNGFKKNRAEMAGPVAATGQSAYFSGSLYPPPFSASCYSIKNRLSFCKHISGKNPPVFCILFQVFRI